MTVVLIHASPVHASEFMSLQGEIIDGRFLVPMRGIFEALGAKVNWFWKTKTVIGTKGNMSINLTINSKVAKINGDLKQLDVPATVIDGKTFIPLRFVSESLGASVSWNKDRRVATIDDEGKTIEIYETPLIVVGYTGFWTHPDYRYMGTADAMRLYDETGATTGIKRNIIGIPELDLVVQNMTNKEIVAFEFTCRLYDAFNRPAYKLGTRNNLFRGLAQQISLPAPVEGPNIRPMYTRDLDLSSGYEKTLYRYWDVYTWDLVLYETASQVKDICITQVSFSDGTVWRKNKY